jgi:hypothetical protein
MESLYLETFVHKAKAVPLHAKQALGGVRKYSSSSILNLGTRRG